MNRSDFLKRLALLAAVGTLSIDPLTAQLIKQRANGKLKNIGVQLFSLPFLLDKNFKSAIALLAKMGYSEIELFGPYPYSMTSAKEKWKAVTPMLGFEGSGYFGLQENEVKAIFKDYGMKIPAMHTDLATLENGLEGLAKAAHSLGSDYLILPAIPDERRKNLDDYKKMADTFNSIGKQAKELGVKFAYHNHGYGLSEVNGQKPLDLIFEGTDPDLVFFEMDLFWTIAGKADPLEYLKKYKGRYKSMHVKDMKELKTFEGDGGDPSQWIPLFPNMTSVGSGVLDIKEIIPTAIHSGVEHFFVEQDMVANPEIALKDSFDYLSSL